MPIENDPISLLLRKIVTDPATTKLLTIIFSAILIVVTAERTRKEWHMVSLLVIYSLALIYSTFSLFVVIFKKQNEIGEFACLKKIFCGRKIYWHEIQTSASFILAVVHLSAFTLIFAGEIYRTECHLIFTILNIFFFAMEFYFAAKIGKTFVLEENFRSSRSCLEIFLGPFHCFPTFFNLVRKVMFIAAAILIAKPPKAGVFLFPFMNVYFFHCIIFAILASFLLFIFQLRQACKNRTTSSTAFVSGHKGQTYLMLIITMHAFLGILCLSLLTGYKSGRVETKDFRPLYDYSEIRHYRNSNAEYEQKNDTFAVIHGNGPTPPPNARFTKYTSSERFYAPLELPIPFALTCFALILSFMDLYSRAIRSQFVPSYQKNNNITITDNNNADVTTPLQIHHNGITKIEDLPIVVAAPHHFTPPQNGI